MLLKNATRKRNRFVGRGRKYVGAVNPRKMPSKRALTFLKLNQRLIPAQSKLADKGDSSETGRNLGAV